mgnify:CR=1 FL=1
MPSLRELLSELNAGFYVVPEVQRPFVWKNRQIRDLMSSIYNNYPVGSVIIWEMPNEFVNEFGDLVRVMAEGLPENNCKYMVIDGQQRLTSLLLLQKGTMPIQQKQRKVDLYFNVIDEQFSLARGSEFRKNPNWFNVTQVLRAETVKDVLEERSEETEDNSVVHNRLIEKRLSGLRERFYTYDMNLFKAKLGYEKGEFLQLFERISQIFVLLNSKGTRIKLPDLVLALLTGRTRKDLGESFGQSFRKLISHIETRGWDIDETVLVRLYMAISTGVTKFTQAKDKLEKTEAKQIIALLNQTGDAAEHAIELLRKDMGIRSPDELQSRYLLVPIAYFLFKRSIEPGRPLPDDMKAELSRWIILASLEGRYTGRLDSDLSEDLDAIGKGGGLSTMLNNLKNREVSMNSLEGEYDNAQLTMLSMLYHRNNAKDWDCSTVPTPPFIKDLDWDDIEVHHVFPQQALKDSYSGKSSPDDTANITLISSGANESIGDRNPSDYLDELQSYDRMFLTKHFVPLEKNLWKVENYDAFLEARRERILQSLREL